MAQSSTRPRQGRDEHLAPVRKPGIMLVRLQDEEARRKAQQLRFQLTSDPLDFVANVVKVPAFQRKVHVVLAPLVDTVFAECADRCGSHGRLLHHATGISQSGRIAARHHVHREAQELEREFSRGCVCRSRRRVAHTAATLESHRSGPRKLLQALLVRTQAVQVFQSDRERHTANSEEGFRSRHAGRAS